MKIKFLDSAVARVQTCFGRRVRALIGDVGTKPSRQTSNCRRSIFRYGSLAIGLFIFLTGSPTIFADPRQPRIMYLVEGEHRHFLSQEAGDSASQPKGLGFLDNPFERGSYFLALDKSGKYLYRLRVELKITAKNWQIYIARLDLSSGNWENEQLIYNSPAMPPAILAYDSAAKRVALFGSSRCKTISGAVGWLWSLYLLDVGDAAGTSLKAPQLAASMSECEDASNASLKPIAGFFDSSGNVFIMMSRYSPAIANNPEPNYSPTPVKVTLRRTLYKAELVSKSIAPFGEDLDFVTVRSTKPRCMYATGGEIAYDSVHEKAILMLGPIYCQDVNNAGTTGQGYVKSNNGEMRLLSIDLTKGASTPIDIMNPLRPVPECGPDLPCTDNPTGRGRLSQLPRVANLLFLDAVGNLYYKAHTSLGVQRFFRLECQEEANEREKMRCNYGPPVDVLGSPIGGTRSPIFPSQTQPNDVSWAAYVPASTVSEVEQKPNPGVHNQQASAPLPDSTAVPSSSVRSTTDVTKENTVNYVRIQNHLRDAEFLNAENSILASGPIQSEWVSAQWSIEPVA